MSSRWSLLIRLALFYGSTGVAMSASVEGRMEREDGYVERDEQQLRWMKKHTQMGVVSLTEGIQKE